MIFRRQYNELEKKFEFSRSKLVATQVIISRLSLIANRNILYASIYTEYLTKYTRLKDELEKQLQHSLSVLKKMFVDKNRKGLNSHFPSTKDQVFLYVKEVEAFSKQLEDFMKAEEKTRQSFESLKDQVRTLKSDYRSQQTSMSMLTSSFTLFFERVDSLLLKIDEYIEIADYQEADNAIEMLKKLIKEMNVWLPKIPHLCGMVESIIPEKMNDINKHAEVLLKEGYSLHNLMLKTNFEKINKALVTIVASMQKFVFQGIEEQLKNISLSLDEYYEKFEKEKESRVVFSENYEDIYRKVNESEQRFMRLNSSLGLIKSEYTLEEEELNKITVISRDILNLNQSKRALDTLVLSATKQPYSIIVEKLLILKSEYEKVSEKIDSFNIYLNSLNEKISEAVHLLGDYYLLLKDGEHLLSELNIPSIAQKYEAFFETYYESLKNIEEAVSSKPIKIKQLLENVTLLKNEAGPMIEEIKRLTIEAALAEGTILVANLERANVSDYNRLLRSSETDFFQGNFAKSREETLALLKKMHIQLNEVIARRTSVNLKL